MSCFMNKLWGTPLHASRVSPAPPNSAFYYVTVINWFKHSMEVCSSSLALAMCTLTITLEIAALKVVIQ